MSKKITKKHLEATLEVLQYLHSPEFYQVRKDAYARIRAGIKAEVPGQSYYKNLLGVQAAPYLALDQLTNGFVLCEPEEMYSEGYIEWDNEGIPLQLILDPGGFVEETIKKKVAEIKRILEERAEWKAAAEAAAKKAKQERDLKEYKRLKKKFEGKKA